MATADRCVSVRCICTATQNIHSTLGGKPTRIHIQSLVGPSPPQPLRVTLRVNVTLRYASDLGQVGVTSMRDTRLTHTDAVVAGQSMSFALLVAALIQVRT